ncbi:replication/maintenance protein RepL, partial [Bacillus pseudomycoides]
MPNKDDINISKNDLMQILELTGLPLSSVEKLIDLKDAEQKEIEQRKKEADNPPFVQVYKGMGLKALQLLIKDNQLASEIFVFFLDNMNNNNLVMASQQLLSEEFGKGRTTIYKAIKYLEEHNFINVAKVGTANAYIINPEVAFQNAHNRKKYVGFN